MRAETSLSSVSSHIWVIQYKYRPSSGRWGLKLTVSSQIPRSSWSTKGQAPSKLGMPQVCDLHHSIYTEVNWQLLCDSRVNADACDLWSQIAKFMGLTWCPPGSCRPKMGPMLAPWTLLSGMGYLYSDQPMAVHLKNRKTYLDYQLPRWNQTGFTMPIAFVTIVYQQTGPMKPLANSSLCSWQPGPGSPDGKTTSNTCFTFGGQTSIPGHLWAQRWLTLYIWGIDTYVLTYLHPYSMVV